MPFNLFARGRSKTKAVQHSILYWQNSEVRVSRKVMKSIRLKLTNTGELKLSCPHFVSDQELLMFLNEREDWIAAQQHKLASVQQKQRQAVVPGHIQLWGEQQPLTSFLSGSPDTLSPEQLATVQREVLRAELKNYMEQHIASWQERMGVEASFWNVRSMKTKWGSCNVNRKRIWLNLQLASYPQICAEMVLVHELVHLLEDSHNKRFYQLMDMHLPQWRDADAILKQQIL